MSAVTEQMDQEPYAAFFEKAQSENGWFTYPFMQLAFRSIGESLTKEKLEKWLANYPLTRTGNQKTIGLVLAGNIPLVGFHDILCCLVTQHNVLAKLSSKDQHLYQLVKKLLTEIDPSFENQWQFTDSNLRNVDAIIATGSNNSARYFEYYFGKYPNIIRKNRNSLALLTGDETDGDLQLLANDIFTYFGLGCRNVSMVWVPENFDLNRLFRAFANYYHLIENHKYANNYEYQRAIMLLDQKTFLDNHMILLREENQLSSPIAVLHYQTYKNTEACIAFVEQHTEKIQCVVSKTKWPFESYELGSAQKPELWDYADQVDTLSFLLNLNVAL